MSSLNEKRVYADKTDKTVVFIATAAGLARVTVSGDRVGEFGLARRCTARDVAVTREAEVYSAASEDRGGALAVATDQHVLVGPANDLQETGFGPAAAVSFLDGLIAAGEGQVARYANGEWETLGQVPNARAIDGDLLAAAGGVFRLDGTHLGLEDAYGLTTAGTPRAATADGLYRLGNGWMDELDGPFRVVTSDGNRRTHAATAHEFYERRDGKWRERDLPVDGPVAGVVYGEAVYVVTADGTLLVDAGDGWRARVLGLPDVRAIAVA